MLFFGGVSFGFLSGLGPRKCITSSFKKFLKIGSPHSLYFGLFSRLKNAFSSLLETLKSTSSKILIISLLAMISCI
ncbi:hypothetical protein GCM10022271_13630 [Corallibacter vietnamensis]|uniref:Uncharacterized protein n=1 Tax=Corallibacter vietnamensis TaxID=904130 RepID=A0ABP7H563_9FLAO